MSTVASPKTSLSASPRVLPLVVHFQSDAEAIKSLAGLQRFRRILFDDSLKISPEIERIYVISSEQLAKTYYDEFRRPNSRLIAISSARFRDARFDGVVYTYLPPGTTAELVERVIDNALDHIHLLHSRQSTNERLRGVTREIHELNAIGAALSAEHDTGTLLELILTKCREITNSDAGSLYLVDVVEPVEVQREVGLLPEKRSEGAGHYNSNGTFTHPNPLVSQLLKGMEPRKRLRFKLAQNDSVSVPFREITIEISDRSIAGYVASTGEIVNIEDAYHLPAGVPFIVNRKFDEDSGYRTKSILAVPMRNQKDEIVGVLQLINSKRDVDAKLTSIAAINEHVIPYETRQQEIVASLASQAAVALENSRLYEAIQRLFEGFVRASVIAIEARDPTTSGHSFRVANLTVALAEAVNRAGSGPYAPVRFSREEMREIRYASLLHDFGKVGVREEVLVKAKKLYPAQLDLVHQRFEFVKRSMEVASLRSRLTYLLEKGREQYLEQLPAYDGELAAQIKEIDDFFQAVLTSNEPTVLPGGSFDRLLEIAARHYSDYSGSEQPLLTSDEVRLLSIRKGSLDDDERLQIESHVVHTFNFLQQIPWTKEIKNIPEIARGHHEKLNGLGYPYKLTAPEIPVQTRMMTISDIFDALSAADRPYKKAVSLDRALEILGYAVKDGELDPALYNLFLDAKVYEKWRVEPHAY
jgi:HD-GYP domain-containing protein (c-di-GMP phosphodiesterase class II)